MKTKPAIPLFFILLLALVAAGCGSVPDGAKAAEPSSEEKSNPPFSDAKKGVFSAHSLVPDEVTVPAGTAISVRLQNAVSSASNRPGDEFSAVLDDSIIVDGKTVAPRGAAVKGRVVAARSSGRMHSSGYLRLALVSVDLNGKTMQVHTSTVFAMGGSHEKRNLALIGGGAGAGTTGAYATGKKDVSFAPERRLTFRLTQPVVAKA
jgi:hypothetical protein